MTNYGVQKKGLEILAVLGVNPEYVLQEGFHLEPSGEDLIVRWQGKARLYGGAVSELFKEAS